MCIFHNFCSVCHSFKISSAITKWSLFTSSPIPAKNYLHHQILLQVRKGQQPVYHQIDSSTEINTGKCFTLMCLNLNQMFTVQCGSSPIWSISVYWDELTKFLKSHLIWSIRYGSSVNDSINACFWHLENMTFNSFRLDSSRWKL